MRFAPTSSELGTAGALQPDGKIVMAGAVGIPGSGTAADFALARYNPDGALDTAFDGDGKVITDFASQTDYAVAIAVQPDRKILAAGWSRPPSEVPFDVAVARYNPDGSLDTSFSADGRVNNRHRPGFRGLRSNRCRPAGRQDHRRRRKRKRRHRRPLPVRRQS